MRGRAAAALLVLLALAACHKRAPDDADDGSSRGLRVQAYDPVIPKAPLKGKLDTLGRHPEEAGVAIAPASSELPVADSSQAASKN